MASQYQIIVQAVLSQADIQKQLNNLKINPIKITTDNADIERAKIAISQLKNDIAKIDSVNIKLNAANEPTAAIVKYTDNLGLAQQALLVIDEETKQWALAQTQVTQNLDKTRAALAKEAEEARKVHAENAADTQKRLDNYNKINNQLDLLKIKNKDAFANDEVRKNVSNVQNLLESYKNGTARIEDVRQAMDTLKNSVAQVNENMHSAQKSGMGFISMLEMAIKKIAVWALGTGAIYGTLRQIREGVEYVKDLNKELTNVALVTGANGAQIRALAIQYNDLAKELGATTLEVAKGSLEWFRQGKTAAEAAELMRSTTMMAKLGNMEAADATEKLTATLNGFELSAKDAITVIDKLVKFCQNT